MPLQTKKAQLTATSFTLEKNATVIITNRGRSKKQGIQQHPETTHTCMSNRSQIMESFSRAFLYFAAQCKHLGDDCHVSTVV